MLLLDTLEYNQSSLNHTSLSLNCLASGYYNVAESSEYELMLNNVVESSECEFEPYDIDIPFDGMHSLKGVDEELSILAWQLDNLLLCL